MLTYTSVFSQLIPYPRVLEPLAESLSYPGKATLSVAGLPDGQARDFQRLCRKLFGKTLATDGLAITVQVDSGHAPEELKEVSATLRKEAYELRVDAEGIRLTAACLTGLQRGIMTVKQLLEDAEVAGELPGCHIVDWPRLASRGIHYDLAREIEYRHAHICQIIERLAYFKMNTFHLYLEAQFTYPSAPEITPKGAMTTTQAQELVAVARLFGIQLVPQIATLGHMTGFLQGPYTELREVPEDSFNLCPTHPRARPFLAGLIRDIAEAFHPEFIHLGYDESHSGHCDRCRQKGSTESLLADHLNWLNDEVKKYGARSMIYGDKFLSEQDFPFAVSVNGGTPDEARAALSQVNRDIIITNWHYTAPRSGTVSYLVAQGFEVHMVTATNAYWNDAIPFRCGPQWMVETIDNAVSEGATGAFNCNWELYRGVFFENHWFLQALAAERHWSDHPHDFIGFAPRFSQRFWGVERDYFSDIAGLLESIPTGRREFFLNSGILTDSELSRWNRARTDSLVFADYLDGQIAILRSAARRNGDSLRMLDMLSLIIRYIGVRRANVYFARFAAEQGDRNEVIRAFKEIRKIAMLVRRKLDEGYQFYGGAVEDRKRLENHLHEIDEVIASENPCQHFTSPAS